MSSTALNDDSCLLYPLPPEPNNASTLMLATRYSNTLLEENKSLNVEVERLTEENLQLKRDLEAQSLSLHNQLQCHKKASEDHVSELDRELQRVAEREKASEAMVTKLRKANENLTEKTRDLQAAIDQYARECKDHSKESSEIRKHAKENEQTLREELLRCKKENEMLKQSLQDVQKTCNSKESQNQALEERISELIQCYKNAMEELDQSKSTCEDREEMCVELSMKLRELEDESRANPVSDRISSQVCSPSPSISLYEELLSLSQDPVTSTRNGTLDMDMSEEAVLDQGWDSHLCADCSHLKEQITQLENMLLKCVQQKLRLQEEMCKWEEDMAGVIEQKVQNFCAQMGTY